MPKGDIELPNESRVFDERIPHDPNNPRTMSELDRQYAIRRDYAAIQKRPAQRRPTKPTDRSPRR